MFADVWTVRHIIFFKFLKILICTSSMQNHQNTITKRYIFFLICSCAKKTSSGCCLKWAGLQGKQQRAHQRFTRTPDQRYYMFLLQALSFKEGDCSPPNSIPTLEIRAKTSTQAQIYDGAMCFAQEVLEFCTLSFIITS